MGQKKPTPAEEAKRRTLREQGALHPHPESVRDELFGSHEFFDPHDRVQVKYEMLRRHRVDGDHVTEVAGAFGLSRQAFYKTEAVFQAQGVPGLIPRRRGPKRAHKCTDEILDFVEQWRLTRPAAPPEEWANAVREHFGVSIHPRSIDRALARRKKKRPRQGEHQ